MCESAGAPSGVHAWELLLLTRVSFVCKKKFFPHGKFRDGGRRGRPWQPVEVTAEQLAEAETFVMRRLEQLLVDEGNTVQAVRAVISQRGADPAITATTVRDLQVRFVKGILGFLPHSSTTMGP